MALSTIEQALDALRNGKPVLVADDENRENEGDAIIAAQFATTEWMAWLVKNTTGFLCAPMEDGKANELELPLMTMDNQDPHGTSYTITVDAAARESTGVSASDRAYRTKHKEVNLKAPPNIKSRKNPIIQSERPMNFY